MSMLATKIDDNFPCHNVHVYSTSITVCERNLVSTETVAFAENNVVIVSEILLDIFIQTNRVDEHCVTLVHTSCIVSSP